MTLKAEYERLCETPSDIYLHLPRFVHLVRTRGSKHVIELGTRTGVSTVAWLFGLEGTGGHLTSVDIDPKPDIGEHDHWTFIQGDDTAPDVLCQLDEADIVFIDTSHLYDHTRVELELYRYLCPGGLIVCHDTQLRRPEGSPPRPLFPVRTAIEDFCAAEGLTWTEYPECWGLGVIEVI